MVDLAERGMAIIMISSELPEILGMSDRIAVMHAGTIARRLSREEATPAEDPVAGAGTRRGHGNEVAHRREISVAVAIVALLDRAGLRRARILHRARI